MFVIPTTSAEHLARKLRAANTKIIYPALNKERKRVFPDGEVYVKIPQAHRLVNQRVVVMHTGAPFPNEGLIELELALRILKEVKANPIEIFFTYFPYGMQDSVFSKGETNVAEMLVEKFVQYYYVKKISIIDAHFAGKEWVRRYPLHLLSAVPLLLETAKKDWGSELLFLAPDKGGKRRTTLQGIQKKRKNSYVVEMNPGKALQEKIKNRVVAVVDDLVETGGTLDKFYDKCRRIGAKELIALITHGVLPQGISRVKNKYAKLYLTNSINRPESNVNVIPLITPSLTSLKRPWYS